ncbi:MAG: hypothetical protein DME87_02075 [Verrucomicrobia bacterium]|nr:MAG: hypothetical protein DME87_02075 [Verrucomicrobiota bacterium]
MKAVAFGAGKVSYPRLAAFRARFVVGSKESHTDVTEDLKDEFDGGNRPLTLLGRGSPSRTGSCGAAQSKASLAI